MKNKKKTLTDEEHLRKITGYGVPVYKKNAGNGNLEFTSEYKNWEKKHLNDQIELYKKITEKSLDAYWGEPKSENAKKLYTKMDSDKSYQKAKINGTKDRHKYNEEILGVVLTDLGYRNTQQNRDYIRDIVFWD